MNLLAILLLLLATVSDAELVQQAEAAFEEGLRHRDDAALARPHFHRAAELYQQLEQRGGRNRRCTASWAIRSCWAMTCPAPS